MRIIPFSYKKKLIISLNLEWIFNRLSLEYSHCFYSDLKHPVRENFLKFISNYLEKDFSVLDLGCGSGQNTFLISSIVKNVIGIDYCKKDIETAKRKYKSKNLSFFCGEAREYLSNCNQKYDVLILSHVLEHLDEPQDFIEKLKHHFKYVYIEVPDIENTLLPQIKDDLRLDLKYNDPDHVAEFSRDDLENIFLKSKLKILGFEYKFGFLRYWCEI